MSAEPGRGSSVQVGNRSIAVKGQPLIRTILRAGAATALGLERIVQRTPDPARANQVSSVLVLEYNLPLGTCVHMTPLYEALRRRRIHVTVATRGLGLGVLRHSPFVDSLLETPDPLTDLGAAVKSLRQQLRDRNLTPECCLTGLADQRSRTALLAIAATRGWRGGFTVHDVLYQRPLTPDWNRSQIENNLRLAEMVGCAGPLLEPRLFYTADDAAHARSLLAPAHAAGRPVMIVVSQNSGGQPKNWFLDRWCQTLRQAHQQLGYEPVYVGTAAEGESIEALRVSAGGAGYSVAGQTTIGQLAALLALADIALTLDTGTMHLGRTVDLPMVVLAPSWQPPEEWLPLGRSNVRILLGELRKDIPPEYQLDEISAPEAISALEDLASLYPPSEQAREARLTRNLSSIDLLCR
jgi:ADP-heptose:LPS heptosyltransferase